MECLGSIGSSSSSRRIILLAAVVVLSTASADFTLSRLALYGTHVILLHPLVPLALLSVSRLLFFRHVNVSKQAPRVGSTQTVKLWTAAVPVVTTGYLRLWAVRWNRSWVWTGVEVFVPILLGLLPQTWSSSSRPSNDGYSAPPSDSPPSLAQDSDDSHPSSSARPSTSSASFRPFSSPAPTAASPVPISLFLLPALVGAELFLTDLASVWGVWIAVLLIMCETATVWSLRELAAEHQGKNWRDGIEVLCQVAWRGLCLHSIVYLALFPLGLHTFPFLYFRKWDILTLVAWPFLSLLSLIALFALLACIPEGGDEGPGWATLLSAKNCLFLALTSMTGQEARSTGGTRFLVFLTYGGVAVWSAMQERPGLVGSAIQLPVGLAKLAGRGGKGDSTASSSPPSEIDLDTRPSGLGNYLSPHPSLSRRLSLLSLLPFALWLISLLFPLCATGIPFTSTCHSVDIVVSHFNRPLPDVAQHIRSIKTFPLLAASRTKTRVVLYHKGTLKESELWDGLGGAIRKEKGDSVVLLPNWGREGGTYLSHILSRYDFSSTVNSPSTLGRSLPSAPLADLADQTLFLQSHIHFDFVLMRRLYAALSPSTGFLTLGPIIPNTCGEDEGRGGVFVGVQKIWQAIKGVKEEEEGAREQQGMCASEGKKDTFASTWGGQMAVSRETILKNQLGVYEQLKAWVEAPDDDPIHHEWNPMGPSSQSDPAFGHSLERSWPLIFYCDDPSFVQQCPDSSQSTNLPGLSAPALSP